VASKAARSGPRPVGRNAGRGRERPRHDLAGDDQLERRLLLRIVGHIGRSASPVATDCMIIAFSDPPPPVIASLPGCFLDFGKNYFRIIAAGVIEGVRRNLKKDHGRVFAAEGSHRRAHGPGRILLVKVSMFLHKRGQSRDGLVADGFFVAGEGVCRARKCARRGTAQQRPCLEPPDFPQTFPASGSLRNSRSLKHISFPFSGRIGVQPSFPFTRFCPLSLSEGKRFLPEFPSMFKMFARGPDMSEKIRQERSEWRKILTPQQYHVTRQKGTEPPGTGEYEDTERGPAYMCASVAGTAVYVGDEISFRFRMAGRASLRRSMKKKWRSSGTSATG